MSDRPKAHGSTAACSARAVGRRAQARAAASAAQPGDVHGPGRQRVHDRTGHPGPGPRWRDTQAGFVLAIAAWLWFTLLFANFAEAIAEGRRQGPRRRAAPGARRRSWPRSWTIPATRSGSRSSRRRRCGRATTSSCIAKDVIPCDGEVVEGVASVDESAITGESAPVIRESGGDRSSVTGGTRVLSDWLIVRVTANPGESFLDRMIAMVEGAKRHKTPNEIALDILLAALTIVFLLAVVTLLPFSAFGVEAVGHGAPVSLTVLVALLVCLIPTTIGGLLSAIGIAGMDRMARANVIAMSGRAVEAAGDVDVLLLDKTGTITLGNRQATAFLPAPGVLADVLADAAQLASLADETPEGRSIVVLAKEHYGLRERDVHALGARFVPFSAQTRMSGVDLDGREIRKGAADAVEAWVVAQGGAARPRCEHGVDDDRAAAARRRSSSPTARACSASSSSRTSSRAASGALRRAAPHGHQDRHDHRRQRAHRGRDRRRGRRRRLPGRGDAGGQARAHPQAPGGWPPGRDDRRRHQRRAGAGAGRRRGRDELRHPGGQGSRQHGRPRLEPDQAHPGRRDRQAAADDARRAHHLQPDQRRRQVLRDPAGRLRRHLPRSSTRSNVMRLATPRERRALGA